MLLKTEDGEQFVKRGFRKYGTFEKGGENFCVYRGVFSGGVED